jgi:hypothetical protein
MNMRAKLARWSRLKFATPEEAAAKREELIKRGIITPEREYTMSTLVSIPSKKWQQAENEASHA